MPDEAIIPGATALTRTLAPDHSNAVVSVRLTIPARAAPDCATVGRHPLCVTLARHQEAAEQIATHHRVKAVGGNLFDRTGELPASVVHKAIDPFKLRKDRFNRLCNFCLFANIEIPRGRNATRRPDFCLDLGEFVGPSTDQRNLRAQCRKFMRGAPPNATAAAGYDDNAPRKEIWPEYTAIVVRPAGVIKFHLYDTHQLLNELHNTEPFVMHPGAWR
jgi:hypothetical protein